jgi:hypothetical protein
MVVRYMELLQTERLWEFWISYHEFVLFYVVCKCYTMVFVG